MAADGGGCDGDAPPAVGPERCRRRDDGAVLRAKGEEEEEDAPEAALQQQRSIDIVDGFQIKTTRERVFFVCCEQHVSSFF